MPAARLAGLTWSVDCEGMIPVAQVKDLSIAGAGGLPISGGSGASRIYSIGISRSCDRPEIEESLGSLQLIKRVPERHGVQRAPRPQGWIGSCLLF